MPIATTVNIKQNLSSCWKKRDKQFATEVTGQRRNEEPLAKTDVYAHTK
jgi:hypothetical protein